MKTITILLICFSENIEILQTLTAGLNGPVEEIFNVEPCLMMLYFFIRTIVILVCDVLPQHAVKRCLLLFDEVVQQNPWQQR